MGEIFKLQLIPVMMIKSKVHTFDDDLEFLREDKNCSIREGTLFDALKILCDRRPNYYDRLCKLDEQCVSQECRECSYFEQCQRGLVVYLRILEGLESVLNLKIKRVESGLLSLHQCGIDDLYGKEEIEEQIQQDNRFGGQSSAGGGDKDEEVKEQSDESVQGFQSQKIMKIDGNPKRKRIRKSNLQQQRHNLQHNEFHEGNLVIQIDAPDKQNLDQIDEFEIML